MGVKGLTLEVERVTSEKTILSAELSEQQRKRKAAELSVEQFKGRELKSLAVPDLKRIRQELVGSQLLVDERICELEVEALAQEKADAAMSCVACLQNRRSVTLLPCRHFILCTQCAENTALATCPHCR